MKRVSRRSILVGAAAAAGVAATNAATWWTPAAAQEVSDAPLGSVPGDAEGSAIDTVVFGDSASERAHGLSAELSDVVQGALGQPARVLNPRDPASWWGGTTKFTLKVSPGGPNHLTVKFYGGDHAPDVDHAWRLQVFLDGKVLGWFDQAVVDNIDMIDVAPRLPGRFFCHTLPLPESYTRGRKYLEIEIRAMGRIWPYGQTPDRFYHPMTTPSRGLYRAYTHTDPYFQPAADDDFGQVGTPTVRTSTDAEMIAKVKARVLKDQNTLLYGAGAASLDAWAYITLLDGYYWPESPAYRNRDALEKVCQAIDGRYLAWKKDARVLTDSDQQWEGFGRVGLALCTAWDDLQDALERDVTRGQTSLPNLGFEGGSGTTAYGWDAVGWARAGTVVRDITVAHEGAASLKITANPGGSIVVSSTSRALTGQGDVSFRCWAKTDGTATTAKVVAQFYNDAGSYVGGDVNTFARTGTADWQLLSNTVPVPAGATRYEFWMNVRNGETAWFDDISITAPDPSVANGVIHNPGFEMGTTTPSYWNPAGWARAGTYVRDTTVAHGGAASVKLTADAGGSMLLISGTQGTTGPGEVSYSCWAKTDGTATTAKVVAQFYNDAGSYVGGDVNTFARTGTADWQLLSNTVPVPAGATRYEFWMNVRNGETAWFDDISITAPPVATATEPVPRRTAYREMMLASREYWRQHQRHYTNQAQFTAIGIYECNRGLALLSPDDAWPEEKARKWLYEAVGLEPWSGPETPAGEPTWTLGHNYHVFSPKGLSRELGYVADYGEVSAMLVRMYEAVTGGKGGVPDERLKQQMIKIVKARAWFRHPAEDDELNHAMRIETQIGWRNEPFPGDVVYVQRTDWDGHPLQATAVFAEPELAGRCQEMVADGQLAPQLELLATHSWTRVGLNAFRFITRDLPAFQALPASASRMPANWDAPDFVFTDEVNGCLAVKRDREIFYASLYWRARQAVNDLARVHLLTPQSERSATVRQKTVFDKDPNNTFTVQDWVCWDFGINDSGNTSAIPSGGLPYPGPTLHQALAGETLYLAPAPADVPDPALGSTALGVEKLFVGKAPFYILEYAGYLVAMNTTTDQTFTYEPGRTGVAVDLRTGEQVPLTQPVSVPPLTTVVLYDACQRQACPSAA